MRDEPHMVAIKSNHCVSGRSPANTLIMNQLKFIGQQLSTRPNAVCNPGSRTRRSGKPFSMNRSLRNPLIFRQRHSPGSGEAAKNCKIPEKKLSVRAAALDFYKIPSLFEPMEPKIVAESSSNAQLNWC